MAKLKENEILGESGKSYQVVSVKMKYLISGFYTKYSLFKEHGTLKLTNFSDSPDIVMDFLTAVFNSKEIAKDLIESDDLDIKMMKEIIEKTQILNEIEPEVPNEITPTE